MPIYEYRCDCGRAFDKLMPISGRHDVLCSCGKKPQIKIGGVLHRTATLFSVVDHDGTILHQTQTIEKTPPPGYRYENPNLVEV